MRLKFVLFFTGKSGYSSVLWDQLRPSPTPKILCLSIIRLNMATVMADQDVRMLQVVIITTKMIQWKILHVKNDWNVCPILVDFNFRKTQFTYYLILRDYVKVSIERMIKQKLELLKKAYKHTEDGYPSHCTPDFNTTAQKPKFLCLLRSSVSVWVSVWVIWRITNRHSVKYAELRIGILLKVCRFLIRHTLPNADVISSYHAVKYAELRIGILLEYCRFLNRHTLKVCRFLIRHTMR